MIVKSAERQERTFKVVSFLVGAIGECMMVALMTFKEGQEVGTHFHPHEQVGFSKLLLAIEVGDRSPPALQVQVWHNDWCTV